jgi:vacuolar protein sorting-associated protein 1
MIYRTSLLCALPERRIEKGKGRSVNRLYIFSAKTCLSFSVGVLTKPDTLTKGSTSSQKKWKEILQGDGDTDKLKHGYYCVRLPDDVERSQNIARRVLIQQAADFFDKTPPWKDVTDRSRFGIPSFVANVSTLLVQLIEQTFVIFP